jgi:hypothetical protein
VAEAHALYTTEAALWKRWEAEARLLAGQDDEAVAAACGLTAEGVQWYHALYFEVRPRLDARLYIHTVVLGRRVHAGLRADDYEMLLKLFGFELGPLAVDDLLRLFRDPPAAPAQLGGLDDAALCDLAHRLRAQVAVLTVALSGDSGPPSALLGLHFLLRRAKSGAKVQPSSAQKGRAKWVPTAADALTFLDKPAVSAHKPPDFRVGTAAAVA